MGTCISLFYYRIDINGEVIFWRCRWRVVWMDLRIGPGQWLVNGSMLVSTKNNNLHAWHTQWWPFTVEMVQCITASKRNVFSLPTSGCFWGFYDTIRFFNAYICHKQCGRKKLLPLSKKKQNSLLQNALVDIFMVILMFTHFCSNWGLLCSVYHDIHSTNAKYYFRLWKYKKYLIII